MKPEPLSVTKSCAYERFFPSPDTSSVLNTTSTEHYPRKLSQLRLKISGESCSDSGLFTSSTPRDYTPRATHGSSATASSISQILPRFISENTHHNPNIDSAPDTLFGNNTGFMTIRPVVDFVMHKW